MHVIKYAQWIANQPELLQSLHELRGIRGSSVTVHTMSYMPWGRLGVFGLACIYSAVCRGGKPTSIVFAVGEDGGTAAWEDAQQILSSFKPGEFDDAIIKAPGSNCVNASAHSGSSNDSVFSNIVVSSGL